MLPLPPQLLYQAPPEAQQLTLPDFLKVSHFEHIFLLEGALASALVLTGVEIGARTSFSSRSLDGRRVTYWRTIPEVHTFRDIDPRDAVNMAFLLAVERTQASPQSFCLNDIASQNMESMLVTLDTSHFDISLLNVEAPWNMPRMFRTHDTPHLDMSLLNVEAP